MKPQKSPSFLLEILVFSMLAVALALWAFDARSVDAEASARVSTFTR